MAKHIKITQENLEAVREAFNKALAVVKTEDGKVKFSYDIGTVKREATVYFSELAWLKMTMLIQKSDKEIAWHGIATRGVDPEKDEYFISDILVYPQEVTGATVTTDQVKYQTWLYSHDDEVFNNIRMQGHSHVNMGVTPSTVDTALYNEILSQLDDTMFYIFMIWNKRAEKTVKIYDLAKNILFETADVTVKVLPDETGIEKFLAEAKAMVTERVYTPPATQKTYGTYTGGSAYNGNNGYYGGYYGSGNAASFSGGASSGNAASFSEQKKEAPKEEKKSNVTALPTSKKSNGKRKGKRKGTNPHGGYHQMSFGISGRGVEDYSYPDDGWNDSPC